jgi:leader peptidase (prepilin peptidase)/N-methyltransferase
MDFWLVLLYGYLALASMLLVYMDLKHHLLPNLLTFGSYPVVAALLSASAFSTPEGFSRLGRAGFAAGLVLVGYIVLHLVNRSGLGMGDVKLSPILGAVLGWHSWGAVLAGVIYGFLAAGMVAAVLLISKRLTKTDEIAFVPFMILGFWLAIVQTS